MGKGPVTEGSLAKKHVIVIEATDKEGRIGRSQMTLTVAEAK